MISSDSFGQELHSEPVMQGEEYAGICARETGGSRGAILFNDGTKNVWLPKSLIKIVSDEPRALRPGGPIVRAMTIVVSEKIAREKGLST